MSSLSCPRCTHALAPGYGALGEDACGECGGRVLSPALTKQVLLDEGGLDPRLVQELARESGGKTLSCPSCAKAMSPVTLKGTAVDICFPCGVTFLDGGELERFSRGRHLEHAPPPTRVRPVDQLALVEGRDAGAADEAVKPPDPRADWEKAVPLYVVEAWAVWLLVLAKGWASSPLGGVGVALGVVAVPLGLSTLANMNLRDLFLPRHRRYGFLGWGHRHHGYGGVLLFIAGLFVGGLLSMVNAMIAERFPKVFNTRNALYALGALLVAGAGFTVLG